MANATEDGWKDGNASAGESRAGNIPMPEHPDRYCGHLGLPLFTSNELWFPPKLGETYPIWIAQNPDFCRYVDWQLPRCPVLVVRVEVGWLVAPLFRTPDHLNLFNVRSRHDLAVHVLCGRPSHSSEKFHY